MTKACRDMPSRDRKHATPRARKTAHSLRNSAPSTVDLAVEDGEIERGDGILHILHGDAIHEQTSSSLLRERLRPEHEVSREPEGASNTRCPGSASVWGALCAPQRREIVAMSVALLVAISILLLVVAHARVRYAGAAFG
jgi:hypothetical protein